MRRENSPKDINRNEVVFNVGESPSSKFTGRYSGIVFIVLINLFVLYLIVYNNFKQWIVGVLGLLLLDVFLLISYWITCVRITIYENFFEVDYGYKIERVEFDNLSNIEVVPSMIGGDFELRWQTASGIRKRCIYNLSYGEQLSVGKKDLLRY